MNAISNSPVTALGSRGVEQPGGRRKADVPSKSLAKDAVVQSTITTTSTDSSKDTQTPRLELNDIKFGKVLGSGQFGLVSEVLSIANCPPSLQQRQQQHKAQKQKDEQQPASAIQHARRKGKKKTNTALDEGEKSTPPSCTEEPRTQSGKRPPSAFRRGAAIVRNDSGNTSQCTAESIQSMISSGYDGEGEYENKNNKFDDINHDADDAVMTGWDAEDVTARNIRLSSMHSMQDTADAAAAVAACFLDDDHDDNYENSTGAGGGFFLDKRLAFPPKNNAEMNENMNRVRRSLLFSSISRSMSFQDLLATTDPPDTTGDCQQKNATLPSAVAYYNPNNNQNANNSISKMLRLFKSKKWNPYVIKTVQKGLKYSEECLYAADILEEARVLTIAGRHENLVCLRAIVGSPGSSTFAILLDRVHEVLDDTIAAWKDQAIARMQREKQQKQAMPSGNIKEGDGGSRKQSFLPWLKSQNNSNSDIVLENDGSLLTAERVLAMYDVAKGLHHLHKKRIIYRDLKPANIGVDIHTGHVKIFDFGTAVHLDSSGCSSKGRAPKHAMVDKDNETFRLTNEVGSRRYMAPEVARKDTPYGFKADVYSFAILFWQVMALQLPFDHLTSQKDHYQRVVIEQERPPSLLDETTSQANAQLCPDLPYGLERMMEAAWSDSPAMRPSFDDICQSIQAEFLMQPSFQQ